ncbi:hypothetical protein J1N35_044175 [Gossypium stocksii]|uniref:Uncharacterized protein n=1 Tax=Gossypium stocksii TaxID=47602 RepID=A0A9D3ZFR1_9ROSI|nr:hypothetical protein J1N35_044175 [Gossypium stocksii]
MSSQDMCLFKRTIGTDYGKAQLERLCTGSPSTIEDLITMRNVFLCYVEGHSLNWTSVEMEDALDLRTRLLAVHKKHRIGTRAINVVSSPITVVDNPPPLASSCASTHPPSIEEFAVKDNSKLLSTHRYLNARYLQGVIEGVEVLVPRTVKDRKHVLDLQVVMKWLYLPSLPLFCIICSLRLSQLAWMLKKMSMGLRLIIKSLQPYKEFKAKWKGSTNFYLEDGPDKTSAAVTSNTGTEPAIENTEVVEEEGRCNVAIEPTIGNIKVAKEGERGNDTCDGLD